MADKQKKYRIQSFEAGLMIGIAVLADLVGLVPFVGWIGSIFGGGIIMIWQYVDGVPIISFKPKQAVKKMANVGGNAVGEAASAAVFPSVLIYTALMIGMSRLEDKTGFSVPTPEKISKVGVKKAAKKAVKDNVVQFPTQKQPASVDGIKTRKAA